MGGQSQVIPFAFILDSPGFRMGEFEVEPILPRDRPMLAGRIRTSWLRQGLRLHITDAEFLQDLRTSVIQQPGFGFYLFLEDGAGLEAEIGGRNLPVGRHHGDAPSPLGLLMSWQRPARLIRRTARGTRLRKVLVIVTHEWLEETFGRDSAAIPSASREHLAVSRWFPSQRLAGTIMQLLEPDARGSAVSRLRDESLVLEFVSEALATLQPPTGSAVLRRTDTMQLNRARDLIEGRLSSDLSVAAIATDVGIGVSSLQRLFRQSYGCSIYEYVRARRLDAARALLEQGRSVTTAADAAGYSSAANFATAFRRKFGMTPSQAREGILV